MAIIDLKSDITGTVWKVVKKVGDRVAEDEPIVILESMKMEIPVGPSEAGVVSEILVKERDAVAEGTVVVRVRVDS